MADSDRTTASSDLQRLKDADDFDVAEGYPDIRGWEVKTPDGQTFGKVDDLIVSISEMRVRYVDVDVDRSIRDAMRDAVTPDREEEGHALIPIGAVELDDARDDVIATGLGDLAAYPRYSGRDITRTYETSIRDRLGVGATGTAQSGSSNFYDHDYYEDHRAYAKRRPARLTDDAERQRLTLAEEELNVGKRQVQAGEVDVRKTVETEHVREQVPLVREEVTVERRPLSGADAANVSIGDDEEIRIPVMREEAVVSKRAVAREEIIIRKQPRTEVRTVEADVRRERVDIDDESLTRNVGGAASRTGSTGDRMADRVDDLKDRVDGNPASRPGRDATDRPGR
jgi:uncharacterized protein (TIGR02271 family)